MKRAGLFVASLFLANCGSQDQVFETTTNSEYYVQTPAEWRQPIDGIPEHTISFSLRLKANGGMFFNVRSVEEAELIEKLEQFITLEPQPFLVLTIDEGVDGTSAARIRQLMDQSYCLKAGSGFCGEGPIPSEWPEAGHLGVQSQ